LRREEGYIAAVLGRNLPADVGYIVARKLDKGMST